MGSRYGVRIRKLHGAVLKQQRQSYECPSCSKVKIKRQGTSLWKCKGCGAEFAGGAYTPRTSVGTTAMKILTSVKIEE